MSNCLILLQCYIGGTLCKVKFHHSFLSVNSSFIIHVPLWDVVYSQMLSFLLIFYYAGGWVAGFNYFAVADSISQYIHSPLGRVYYYLMLVLLNYSDQKSCVLWELGMTARLSVARSVPLSTAVVTVVSDSPRIFLPSFILLLGSGVAQWESAGLVIKRSQALVPAGAAGEFSSPGSTFRADSYLGICSTL